MHRPSPAPMTEVSAELLLARVLCTFQRSDMKLHGYVTKLDKRSSKRTVATLQPKTVKCFEDFLCLSDASMSVNEAFNWYARMKLRFACSSCCSLFVDCVIPELLRDGVQFMRYEDGTLVDLKTVTCHEVWLDVPDHVHILRFPLFPSDREESIEIMQDMPYSDPKMPHNVLVSTEVPHVIDMTIGQFSGDMQPVSSSGLGSHPFPSRVAFARPSDPMDVKRQIEMETALSSRNPDKLPSKFAKVVSSELHDYGWRNMCRNCLGTCGHKPLKACTGCHAVWYCGKQCQKLDWKARHKQSCSGKKGKSVCL